jgi:uncharacterized protein YndB with AHSA1/START domain
MYEIHVTATIATPLQQVFETVSDHERFLRGPDLSCHLTREGANHRNGLGALREVATEGRVITEEITAFDPPRHIEYVIRRFIDRNGKTPQFRHDRGWLDFSSSGGETRVDWHSRFQIPIPIVGWFVERFLGPRVAAGFRQVLDQAKKELERQPATP